MAVEGRGVVSRVAREPALVERMTIDDPGPGEVLVRIQASGVCHTDLHVKLGTWEGFPFLLGHEGAGVVEKVGAGVDSPRVGDHVILAWRAPCGNCRFCRRGLPHLCAASLNAEKRMRGADGAVLNPVLGIGTFCTHTVVAARQAVPVPAELPPEQMCLIGCGVMTGIGAVLYSADVQPGTSVAVFGCGGVGTSVIQGARLARATTIIGVDVDPRKLRWAEELGATHVVDASAGDPVARIKEITGGNGVNYSFEAIGRPETLLQAMWSRDLAGTCVLIGVPGPGPTVNVPMQQLFDLGGSLRVSWYGDCLPTRDFPMLAEWYRQGQLKLDYPVVTRTIALEETEEAFAVMERGETLRSVVRIPD
jgi:S-(hydroxymethyl)mycothiol dehydrogenase